MTLLVMLVGPIILIAATTWPPLFWLVIVVTAPLIGLIYLAYWGYPSAIVAALLTWFAINKFLVALLAPRLPPDMATWLLNYKEFMYLWLPVIGLSVIVFRQGSVTRAIHNLYRHSTVADRLAVAFLALLGLLFVLGQESPDLRLVAARRFGSLPIIYLGGRLLWIASSSVRTNAYVVVAIGCGVAIFGLAERLVLGDSFWREFMKVGVFRDSLVDSGVLPSGFRLRSGMPANWTTYLDGEPYRRLVSTFLEPTTLGLFLAFAFVLVAFGFRWRRSAGSLLRIAGTAVIGLALLLTFGKAGLLVVVVVIATWMIRPTRDQFWRLLLITAGIGLVGVVGALMLPLGENLKNHVHGLVSGLGVILEHPIGAGLGSTGYYGAESSLASDSTLGSLGSQMGIAGLAIWSAWMMAIMWQLLPNHDAEPDTEIVQVRTVIAGALAGLFCAAVLSTSPTGLLGSSAYVLLAGAAISAASPGFIIQRPVLSVATARGYRPTQATRQQHR